MNGLHVQGVAQHEGDAFLPRTGRPASTRRTCTPPRRPALRGTAESAAGSGPGVASMFLWTLRLPVVIDNADVHAPGVQIDAAIESRAAVGRISSWPPWKMDAVEPAVSAAAPSCCAASPLGIANLNGNAASAGSGGHQADARRTRQPEPEATRQAHRRDARPLRGKDRVPVAAQLSVVHQGVRPGKLAWDYQIAAPGYPEQGWIVDLEAFNAVPHDALKDKRVLRQFKDPCRSSGWSSSAGRATAIWSGGIRRMSATSDGTSTASTSGGGGRPSGLWPGRSPSSSRTCA